MIQEILIPFLAVGLAELGDKTQLAVLSLASKTKKHWELLLGVILAFVVADGLAIVLGDYLTTIVPMDYIKIAAGAIFIIFGVITLIITLINHTKEESKFELKNPFVSSFLLVLMMEMGDKTQIASGLFATKFNAFFVFLGVIAALTMLSVMAVYLGKIISRKINKKTISIISGILFILIGIGTLVGF